MDTVDTVEDMVDTEEDMEEDTEEDMEDMEEDTVDSAVHSSVKVNFYNILSPINFWLICFHDVNKKIYHLKNCNLLLNNKGNTSLVTGSSSPSGGVMIDLVTIFLNIFMKVHDGIGTISRYLISIRWLRLERNRRVLFEVPWGFRFRTATSVDEEIFFQKEVGSNCGADDSKEEDECCQEMYIKRISDSLLQNDYND